VIASNGQVIPIEDNSSLQFVAEENGIYTVDLTVTDNDGDDGTDQLVITVADVSSHAVDAGVDMTVPAT